jgi:hypothetical protein
MEGLGILVLEMMNGTLPYATEPIHQNIVQAIQNSNRLCIEQPTEWSTELVDFMQHIFIGKGNVFTKVRISIAFNVDRLMIPLIAQVSARRQTVPREVCRNSFNRML